MLISAAVCPHPPLLVPDVAGGAAAELDPLRAACDRAVAELVAAGADEIVVIGAGERNRVHGADAGGSLAGYGVPMPVGPAPAVLPLSLTVGRWLAERGGAAPSSYVEVAHDARPEECLVRGAELAASVPRLAVLAVGDGSARRTTTSPGRVDDRAIGFDTSVAAALADADVEALSALDPRLAEDLMAAGRAAWQTLAWAADGAGLSGRLLAHEAPYGVGYFVASWG
ncbi:class III extradiol dioxygenase subunit B-like domain-containing protein [Nocardiopsis rhodophaea]|uniref:Class III extradiol dioxygenase subunit B-like domain-containing protein n=1 Tax=Nocardiopsis rhodophaea TaxID=280238 RepID=A0ABN2TFY3_9ACTN